MDLQMGKELIPVAALQGQVSQQQWPWLRAGRLEWSCRYQLL